MAHVDDSGCRAPRYWGDDRALVDDEEARRRLIGATRRCIVRCGNAEIGMAEVASEAGAARPGVRSSDQYSASSRPAPGAMAFPPRSIAVDRLVRLAGGEVLWP